jgi:hypothetical protein
LPDSVSAEGRAKPVPSAQNFCNHRRRAGRLSF